MAAAEIIRIGDGRVRLSDNELHSRTSVAIQKGNHIVFESLPTLIAQIIEHKTWRTYQHKDFASYALDATSNGLGINTNQRLWILRCSMDVGGKHIKEWTDVLTKVEDMVKLVPVSERGSIAHFNGNSLETLAKNCPTLDNDRITYLPSRNKAEDGHLIRLHKNKPDIFKRVMRGELSLIEARREAKSAGVMGLHPDNHTDLKRTKQYFARLTPKERREFIDWMKEEGYLE
jgi:hypothetical protein